MNSASKALIGSTLRNQLFINGSFVDAVSKKTYSDINPSNGQEICQVAEAQPEDVDLAVKAARKAFDSGVWKSADAAHRRDILLKTADLIVRDRSAFAALEAIDSGKPMWEADFDAGDAIKTFRYYAGWADKIHGKVLPSEGNNLTFTKHEAIGVVGQIVPWNFPLVMGVWKIAPALAMGCSIVLKPAQQTPLSILYLAAVLKEAGLPDGVFNVVPGKGSVIGVALTEHPLVDKVSFTGSTAVGKQIMTNAAKSLKRVTLELGGKSPLVVFNDADLDAAVEGATAGVFYNQGQVCSSSGRVFVQSKVYDAFLKKMVEKIRVRKQCDVFEEGCEMGPQISKDQMEDILRFIEIGKKEGATLSLGGSRNDKLGDGFFIHPTIFSDVTDEMTIAKEEIFGPVMVILKFETIDEAIERSNATNYGLASGCFTESIETGFRFANQIRAGTCWINTYNGFDICMPFGGYKDSGFGRECGEYALEQYTQVKAIQIALKHKP